MRKTANLTKSLQPKQTKPYNNGPQTCCAGVPFVGSRAYQISFDNKFGKTDLTQMRHERNNFYSNLNYPIGVSKSLLKVALKRKDFKYFSNLL